MIINERTKKGIEDLAKVYDLSLVVLFGSQATGYTHKESDIDIAYVSEKHLSYEDEIRLDSDLTGVFKKDEISLVDLNRASPLLAKQIVSKGIVLYEKKKYIFSDFYIRSLRMYAEAEPLFKLRRHYLDYKIKQYQHA